MHPVDDHATPLSNLISTGSGPTYRDYEPIDELVDEENQESSLAKSGTTATIKSPMSNGS